MPNLEIIISLGEVITPNLNNGLIALANKLAAKSDKSISADDMSKKSNPVIIKNLSNIEKFKLGEITESQFDQLIIDALKQATGIELTIDELNEAWSTMNPSFEVFKLFLEEVTKYNIAENKKNKTSNPITFISYTNPKDIRQLVTQLKTHKQTIEWDEKTNHLKSINSIPLYTTYIAHKKKSDLLKDVIIDSKSDKLVSFSMFGLKSKENRLDASKNIRYICGINKITFDALRKDFDETTKAVSSTAEQYGVDTVLWDKEKHKSISALLNESEKELTHGYIAFAKL